MTKRRHNHHRLLSEISELVADYEVARMLLAAMYAQWTRSGRLTMKLTTDVSLFLQRTEGQS